MYGYSVGVWMSNKINNSYYNCIFLLNLGIFESISEKNSNFCCDKDFYITHALVKILSYNENFPEWLVISF